MINMIQFRTNNSQPKPPTETQGTETQSKCPEWLKYFGLAGFCFFLVKGLLWLIIPALLFYFGFSE
jgi:hypothetical protein